MVPRRALVTAAANLIGADPSNLGAATPFVCVQLVKAPFTPSPDISMGIVTLADFVGSNPIHAASATTAVGTDPANGDQIMEPAVPAGGWRWHVTGTTNLPQTIYGFVLLDSAETTIIASELLQTPVVLTTVGDQITVSQADVAVRLPVSAMS